VLYLLSLPAGWKSYRDHQRSAAAVAEAAATPADAAPSNPAPPLTSVVADPGQDNRPARLN